MRLLRGLAPDRLLDTVETERQPQTEWVIRFAVELGKVLCELDPEAAAARDKALRAGDSPPPLEFPPLTGGVIHRAGWSKSTAWMRTSEDFKANPIGVFVDPDRVAADHADGLSFEEIHAKAMAGGYAPEQAPVEIPEAS